MEYKMTARNPSCGGTEVCQLSLLPGTAQDPHPWGVSPALAVWSFLPKWQCLSKVTLAAHCCC